MPVLPANTEGLWAAWLLRNTHPELALVDTPSRPKWCEPRSSLNRTNHSLVGRNPLRLRRSPRGVASLFRRKRAAERSSNDYDTPRAPAVEICLVDGVLADVVVGRAAPTFNRIDLCEPPQLRHVHPHTHRDRTRAELGAPLLPSDPAVAVGGRLLRHAELVRFEGRAESSRRRRLRSGGDDIPMQVRQLQGRRASAVSLSAPPGQRSRAQTPLKSARTRRASFLDRFGPKNTRVGPPAYLQPRGCARSNSRRIARRRRHRRRIDDSSATVSRARPCASGASKAASAATAAQRPFQDRALAA